MDKKYLPRYVVAWVGESSCDMYITWHTTHAIDYEHAIKILRKEWTHTDPQFKCAFQIFDDIDNYDLDDYMNKYWDFVKDKFINNFIFDNFGKLL